MGDCTGIGPELVANVLHGKRLNDVARLVVVGDARVLELGMRDAGVELRWVKVPNTAAIDWSSGAVPLIDLGNIDPSRFEQGKGLRGVRQTHRRYSRLRHRDGAAAARSTPSPSLR